MSKPNLQTLYKDFMANPHRTPMPGKTKHETAMEAAYKELLQAYNNDMALNMLPREIEEQYVATKRTELAKAQKLSKQLKSFTQEEIWAIAKRITD